MNKVCGIYCIVNRSTSQMYIGQSIDINKRFKEHIKGKHLHCSYIDKAIAKHGSDSFDFKILEECEEAELNTKEKEYISKYDTFNNPNHYNLTSGGEIAPSKIPAIAKKISQSQIGKVVSEETRKKQSIAKLGNNNPKYWLGKTRSEETKAKIAIAKTGENNYMYGKNHSLETKQKMSESISKKTNTSGYYRVYKQKGDFKQGFRWVYRCKVNGQNICYNSVDLKKLEKKVKENGFPFFKLE